MASQRFCLRWNNHQSNLLSVFDQLLHAETFTDVTLAIDGQYLKAHKMVLSACSPYFQALFVNHSEKHPIVILKDVPFADMKSLLDFMYRGEVSVDQERLSAFLRVAESLRIKGLTEVNDDKPSNHDQSDTPPSNNQNRVPPYVLQQQQQQRKVLQQQQQASQAQQTTNNPLLGSALSMPKRKRGRPRKLSGSDDVEDYEDDYRENLLQESPELLEVKMGTENDTNSEDNNSRRPTVDNDEDTNRSGSQNKRQHSERNESRINSKKDDSANDGLLVPKTEPMEMNENDPNETLTENQPQIRVSNFVTQSSNGANLVHVINQLQQHNKNDSTETHGNDIMNEDKSDSVSMWIKQDSGNSAQMFINNALNNSDLKNISSESSPNSSLLLSPGGTSQKSVRRRIRRKHNSPDDQAEALTEMSVRGLNLFRYASIQDGVYKCTECAKENVQKTFKNKYSFQRHAFLYHEGTQRKVFPCPVCRKEFSRPDKMKNHMKMTHDCYLPKECKFPLPLLIAAGSSQSTQSINNNILNITTTQ